MKTKTLLTICLATIAAATSRGQVAISGYMTNPAGTDSPYEYVQLVATANIDFSITPMAVVFANNGTATANGWVQGGSISYELSLTAGTVTTGQTFYVGGNGELVNGSGSASIPGTWIRAVNTGTTGGDLFGTAASGGVVGNGGSSADAIAVFNTTTLTASTVPIDAFFYGSAVGNALVSGGSAGYVLPSNDLYSGGFLQSSSTLLFDPAGGDYARLTGTYDTSSSTWTTPRTAADVASPTSASQIASGITVVPEPSTLALAGLGLTGLLGFRRVQNRKN